MGMVSTEDRGTYSEVKITAIPRVDCTPNNITVWQTTAMGTWYKWLENGPQSFVGEPWRQTNYQVSPATMRCRMPQFTLLDNASKSLMLYLLFSSSRRQSAQLLHLSSSNHGIVCLSSVTVVVWDHTRKSPIGMTIKAPASARSSVGYGPLKSRRGCKTCKARRVKCGEEKPHCLRCTSTGRHCEYAWTIYGTFSSASSATTSIIVPTLALSPAPNRAWRERRAFAYYSQHAAPILGGLDAEFWSTTVPRLCYSEPAVWDAIISISSLFESYKPSRPVHKYQDALGWYSRSVSAVRQQIERGTADVFVGLISCVLFICIEALQGGVTEALRLYCQGTQLALALRAQIASGTVPASKGPLLEDTIVPIFARLSILANQQNKLPVGVLLRDIDLALTPGLAFPSLKAAREAIFVLTAETQLFQETCERHHESTKAFHHAEHLVAGRSALLSRLQNWQAAFAALANSLRTEHMPPQQTSTIALLSTHHEMLYIILTTCTSRFKCTTDTCLQNFQTILEQSRVALNASARSDGRQPPFTFDISVGFPLWFTVLRCAEPRTRREALGLLRRAPEVQGFYANTFGVSFAEAVMHVEEKLAMDMYISMGPPGSRSPLFSTVSPLHSPGNSSNLSLHSRKARIKPYGIFIPRNGIPAGTSEEDVKKWNVSPNQPFLQYSRNRVDRSTWNWRVVDEVIPITIEL
ncbi:hypothetical protein BDV10DRAFT_195139 [Aspergillus recurvatus]